MHYLGINIGGTTSNAAVGTLNAAKQLVITAESKDYRTREFTPEGLIQQLCEDLLALSEGMEIRAIGISCGSPLDSRRGLILSPPNLPNWKLVPVVRLVKDFFKDSFQVPVFLANDANAGALAEWKYGAGRKSKNMIFLTFGTGMGAGIIAENRLIRGASDGAGEVGHIRLERFGPVGYGKQGSFEGFCSGGGIAQQAQTLFREAEQKGELSERLNHWGIETVDAIDAALVAKMALQEDPLAVNVMRTTGEYLGRGLAILVDILNPELLVLGSIYIRNEAMLRKYILPVIKQETLSYIYHSLTVVPAQFGEEIGKMSALSVATYFSNEGN